ncbi:hypothetical protein HanRHA438_Chr03g0142491 [Helianthus annuus]|nr:hypothetical protein HanRHA438_Chr03g0142491 [Helianthus annuus]
MVFTAQCSAHVHRHFDRHNNPIDNLLIAVHHQNKPISFVVLLWVFKAQCTAEIDQYISLKFWLLSVFTAQDMSRPTCLEITSQNMFLIKSFI